MEPPPTTALHATVADVADPKPASRKNSDSQGSEESQTAAEFITDQLQLEADAREALPYAFDTCTQPLGPLRQILFACLTCSPPPSSPSDPFTAAGICYSCSIACHGEHNLVELFNKRDFVCDCGTTRLPAASPCTLRINAQTGRKGDVRSESPAKDNKYNHNFRNRFCGCETEYDACTEKGTMFQCLGLGSVENGGCGEDWWHPACVVGLKPDWHARASQKRDNEQGGEHEEVKPAVAPDGGVDGNDSAADGGDEADADEEEPTPPGFPDENDFESFICCKCVDANPWIKRYAGTEGFLPAVYRKQASVVKGHPRTGEPPSTSEPAPDTLSRKRKADDDELSPPVLKKTKSEDEQGQLLSASANTGSQQPCQYATLPPAPTGTLSLFLTSAFRSQLCRCPSCFPLLEPHPQLLEEEDAYEPPLSISGDGNEAPGSSVGTGSLLDRGERALSNVDRVRAIEGVMVYNHLKDKVKAFLQPFAEEGRAVGAEDIKEYFEKLRGDAEGVKAAGDGARTRGGDEEDGAGRKEQSGY